MNPSPGPWRWAPNSSGSKDAVIVDSNGGEVARGYEGEGGDWVVAEPDDAALIALAPEMREMLLKLEGAMLGDGGDACAWCSEFQHSPKDCEFAALLEKLR
jgi:hypothetical protein